MNGGQHRDLTNRPFDHSTDQPLDHLTDRPIDRSTDLPRANPSIVLREEFDDYAFLYDPDTGETFPLNPAGVFIWRQLDGCSSVDRIVEKMQEGFEGVPASAKANVEAFLDDLKKRRLICT